jgi:S1-C subfamily serine protease
VSQSQSRGALLVALLIALVAGAAGGVAGGVAVAILDDAATPEAVATPAADDDGVPATPTAAVAPEGIIERALPAVVTVFADAPAERDAQGRLSQERSVGSGVVIGDAGHVITNFHVIDGAAEISVLLATGELRDALVVSHDSPYTDLAVLAIPPEGLRSLRFGDSASLRLGQPVTVVAGAGFTQGNSVKAGIVSGIAREWPRSGVILEDLVQTDAAVNQGDSGGALLNDDGELVGLLTTVVRETPTGLAVEGVAFAQSSNSLRPIIEDIIALGVHPRPRLGIEWPFRQHIELTPELAAAQDFPLELGALVIAVEPASAAEAAGVLPGDVVVGVNATPIDLARPFVNLLKALSPGAVAELTVIRGGERLVIPVTPRLE